MGAALGPQRHNLPTRRTRLIGREHDVAAVRQAVLETEGRLVTLTGAGGCGKTRLALQAATDLAGEFHDGISLVELAPLVDPKLVPAAVAAVLGLRAQPSRPMLDTLLV